MTAAADDEVVSLHAQLESSNNQLERVEAALREADDENEELETALRRGKDEIERLRTALRKVEDDNEKLATRLRSLLADLKSSIEQHASATQEAEQVAFKVDAWRLGLQDPNKHSSAGGGMLKSRRRQDTNNRRRDTPEAVATSSLAQGAQRQITSDRHLVGRHPAAVDWPDVFVFFT